MKVTLQTIADEVGVSRTTVSNAFSRPDQLSDDLRDRILRAAVRLGYAGPDPAARILRRGRVGAVGVVLTESLSHAFSDPHAVGFLGGLAEVVEQAGLGLHLIPSPPGAVLATGAQDAVVDGFCVFSLPSSHPLVEGVLARSLPAVFVDSPEPDGVAFVGIDDRRATEDLARHVLGLGHMRIAVLTFRIAADDRSGVVDARRLEEVEYLTTSRRLDGVLETSRGAGAVVAVHELARGTRSAARAVARSILTGPDRPTAIVCFSDRMALGVLDVARELGLEVPEDLSVSGFDDIPEAMSEGLTTVAQSAGDKGQSAGNLLITGEVRRVTLAHRLVVRATTGPPARSG